MFGIGWKREREREGKKASVSFCMAYTPHRAVGISTTSMRQWQQLREKREKERKQAYTWRMMVWCKKWSLKCIKVVSQLVQVWMGRAPRFGWEGPAESEPSV